MFTRKSESSHSLWF